MTVPMVKLNNDVMMPQLGLGVYKIHEGRQVHDVVNAAIQAGYRSIDTAALYGNERGVGGAVRESGIARDDIFITTKVWNADQGYGLTLKAFETSLRQLGMDYIDLYLVHWPVGRKFLQTWRACEYLYEQKLVRAIGVSNFQTHHLDQLLQEANIVPVVNQVELHPRLTQERLREYCQAKGIAVEAWGPLMRGGEILRDEVVAKIAKRHNKTPAQVVLRWHIQRGIIVIPKSATKERIEENINIFDFELSAHDMLAIDQLDAGQRVGPDPDNFHF